MCLICRLQTELAYLIARQLEDTYCKVTLGEIGYQNIMMETRPSEDENVNLLEESQAPHLEEELKQKRSQHQQGQKQQKTLFPPLSTIAAYLLLLLLLAATAYHLAFLFHHHPHAITHTLTPSFPEDSSLSGKVAKEKTNQGRKAAQMRELKLIELQREMLRLNKMIRSKNDYNQQLIATQLQKERQVKLKYWQAYNPDQDTIKKPTPDSQLIPNTIPNNELTHFPKIVWMYVQQNLTTQSNITQLLIANLAEYLQLQGYDFYLIGEYNFRYLMSNRHEEQLGYVLVDLWHIAYETNTTTNLKDHTFTIKKHLISLIMLSELGGILIDKELLLTDGLTWLEDFQKLSFANRGRTERPNIIGFYHKNYTGSIEEVQMNQFQTKEVHLYPPLDPYFLAVSREGAVFISEVLQRYYALLEYYDKTKEIMKQYGLKLSELTGQDPYYQAIFIASSWVLKRRQMQLDSKWQAQGKQSLRPLALDYYGIYAINRVYGPLKYRFLFSEIDKTQIYNWLTKVDYSQLVDLFGHVAYLSFIPFEYDLIALAEKAEAGEQSFAISKDSFFGRFVYKNMTQTWLVDYVATKEEYEVQSGVFWSKLPKIIWVFDSGKSIVRKLCISDILSAANQSNFELNVLTQDNLHKYVQASMLSKINNWKKTSNLNLFSVSDQSVWLELVKLAVLSQHGGVWLDLPIFPLGNFDWLINIHDNLAVKNRVGRLPKVLLFYHGIQSGFPFICDKQHCKIKQSLRYQTTFIAAEAHSNLITLWLSQFLQNIALTDYKYRQKLKDFNITYKQLKSGSQLSRITLLSILAARNHRYSSNDNKQLALQDFGVWLLNSFIGLGKLKEYTSFDVGFDSSNPYLWSLPLARLTALLGTFDYLIHLSDKQENYLNVQFIISKELTQAIIHPNSLLAKELLNFTLLEQLVSQNVEKGQEDEANHSSKINELKRLAFPKLVWLYSENIIQPSDEEKRWLQNTIYYCEGYDVRLVNSHNYRDFLTERFDFDALFSDFLAFPLVSEEIKQRTKEQIIMHKILHENGGIYIAPQIYLTEHISWIESIASNHLAVGSQAFTLNFAFFCKEKLSFNSAELSKGTIKPYFLASVKGSFFIADTLTHFQEVITENVQNSLTIINPLQIYQSIIQKLSLKVNSKVSGQSSDQSFMHFLKYYGITAIDASYFIDKLAHFSRADVKNLITRMTYSELKRYIGPLKYLVNFQREEPFKGVNYKETADNSFIAKLIQAPNQKYELVPIIEKLVTYSIWEELPKMLWYFRNDAYKMPVDDMIQAQIDKYCGQEVVLMVIADERINRYIEWSVAKEIKKAVQARNKRVHAGIQHYLSILAVMIKHGGIYFSSDFAPTQDFQWFLRLPSNIPFYNRYSKQPSLVHFFKTSSFQFDTDLREEVEVADISFISLQFLAATKSNPFLIQLYNETMALIAKDDGILNSLINQYTSNGEYDEQIEPQIIIKLVYASILDKKAKEFQQSAEIDPSSNQHIFEARKFFNIWGIPLQIGPSKLSQPYMTNLASTYSLYCQLNASILDEVFGVPQFFITLSKSTKNTLANGNKCLQQSYFSRYLHLSPK